jgi:hypothetical protein
MSSILPVCSIGIKTAHCLILNLMLCHSVNIVTVRCDDHGVDHIWLFYIDRIQDRIEQILNITVFQVTPPSCHVSQHMCCSGSWVIVVCLDLCPSGRVHAAFDWIHAILAKCMNWTCLPIPCSTKEDFNIYNAFLRAHPKPNERH